MRDFIIFIPIMMIVFSVALSVTAFKGGFSFAYVRFLKKFRKLYDHIAKPQGNVAEDAERLMLLNEFLASIKVENEKVTVWDWWKRSFFTEDER